MIAPIESNSALVPVGLYTFGFLLKRAIGQWRNEALRDEMVRLGSDWCFLSLTVVVGAMLDMNSRFRLGLGKADLVFQVVVNLILFLLAFIISTQFMRAVQERIGGPLRWWYGWKTLFFFFGSQLLGMIALVNMWAMR